MGKQDIHNELWKTAVEKIRARSPATFDRWFSSVQLGELSTNQLTLQAQDEFVRDWVKDHFQPALLEELDAVGLHVESVVWTLCSELDEPIGRAVPSKPVVPRALHVVSTESPPQPPAIQLVQPLVGVNPKNTFANFVIGPSNQLAFAASVAASGGSGRRYNPLFLCGSTGLGKTHLLHAIAHHIHGERPAAQIVYGSADSFTSEYIRALTERKMDEFRARYHRCDVLLIDDLQSLAGRNQTQEEFFNTFNVLHAQDKQIVLAADKYPQQLDRMEQRLVSRFTWGLVADVQTPELETRIAIVRKKALLENIDLQDEVALLLAQTVQSNVRELEGLLIRLIAKSSLMNCPLDQAFAERELTIALPKLAAAKAPTLEQIQREVCEHFHVNPTDMLSHIRHRSVSRARHVAMYLCRERLKCSYPEIGRAFANRDHTTVMSAVRKVQAMRENDPELRAQLEAIERRLGSE